MSIHETELVIRLLVAVVLGGAIGYERELREQPAGLRTHLLVSLGSAVFTLVSLFLMGFQADGHRGLDHYDPGRIASNTVVGIGFLGGGAILHSRMTVKGLTTAASLWLAAAIGLAAGGGMYILACVATMVCLFALVVLRYAVEGPLRRRVRLGLLIEFEGPCPTFSALAKALAIEGVGLEEQRRHRDVARDRAHLKLQVKLARESLEEPFLQRLEALPGIRTFLIERPD